MNKLNFSLISPERVFFKGEVNMVILPAENGEMGILWDHSPFIVSLKAGLIKIYQDQKISHQIFVFEGFANINPEGCQVLAEEIVEVEELRVAKIEDFIDKIREEIDIAHDLEDKERLSRDLRIAYAKQQVIHTLTDINS